MKNHATVSYTPAKYEKPLCYATQAPVIPDFNHIINTGLFHSLSALPFNHCQPGKRGAWKEEQNHWSRHHKNTLRTGTAEVTAQRTADPHTATCFVLQVQTAAKWSQWLWWPARIFKIHYSIKTIHYPTQYKGQPSSGSLHTLLTVLLRISYSKIISYAPGWCY